MKTRHGVNEMNREIEFRAQKTCGDGYFIRNGVKFCGLSESFHMCLYFSL